VALVFALVLALVCKQRFVVVEFVAVKLVEELAVAVVFVSDGKLLVELVVVVK
jgi:hypothetical protein